MCEVQLVAMPCMKWNDIFMLHCSGIVRLAVWRALWFALASRQIWLILTEVPNATCVTNTVLKGQHPIAVAFVPKSAEVQEILMSLLSWPRAVGWLIIFRQFEKSGLEGSQQAHNQNCYWMLSGSSAMNQRYPGYYLNIDKIWRRWNAMKCDVTGAEANFGCPGSLRRTEPGDPGCSSRTGKPYEIDTGWYLSMCRVVVGFDVCISYIWYMSIYDMYYIIVYLHVHLL